MTRQAAAFMFNGKPNFVYPNCRLYLRPCLISACINPVKIPARFYDFFRAAMWNIFCLI
jgi:hypothetical protein